MNSSSPAPATPSANAPRKRPWLLWGCGGFIALLLLVIAVLLFLLWWSQRPITPVTLTPPEKEAVEVKLRQLGGAPAAEAGGNNRPEAAPGPEARVPVLPGDHLPAPEPDRPYQPGSKTLRLTEREINGLLNENTDLGEKLRIEFGRDAINAYLAVRVPEDSPVAAGRMIRARGRFRVSLGEDGKAFAVLEDVTVFGLSLPKAWLGGIKGQNLLDDVARRKDGSPILQGLKSLRVEPGALVLEVED